MKAHAKVNLALVVGPVRADGKHEVLTVLQRVELHDVVELEPAEELVVDGFSSDTLVRAALAALAGATGTAPGWRVRIDKRIPVAAGLLGTALPAFGWLPAVGATRLGLEPWQRLLQAPELPSALRLTRSAPIATR